MAVALLAPTPFAALWGRQWPAGLVAGYAFWPVFFGSVPPLLAYWVYEAAERIASVLGKLRAKEQRPALPPPEPFTQR